MAPRVRLHHGALVIAFGVLLVAVDFRTEALDLLPDPLGWCLVAAGAWAMRLRVVGWLALVAAAASAGDAYLPYRRVLIDPLTGRPTDRCPSICGERVQYDQVTGLRLGLVALAAVLGASALVLLATRLGRRAPSAVRRRWRVLAAVVGAGLLAPLAGVAWALARRDGRYDPIWNGAAEYVAIGAVGALAWLVVELYLCDGRSWTGPTGLERSSPWAARRRAGPAAGEAHR